MADISTHPTLSVGFLGHWAMDGNADDSKGVHDGTLVGSPTFEAGKLNQAIQCLNTGFPATDLVTLASHADFTLAQVGVSAWVKILDLAQEAYPFFKGVNYPTSQWFMRFLPANKYMLFGCRIGGNIYEANTVLNSVDDNDWHHFAAGYDGSTVRIWLDSVEKTPSAIVGSIDGALSPLYFAARPQTPYANGLNGQMDEICIHNRIYTQAEVDFLYGGGTPPPYEEEAPEPEPPFPPTPGPEPTPGVMPGRSGGGEGVGYPGVLVSLYYPSDDD
jgi:hypothetical protein